MSVRALINLRSLFCDDAGIGVGIARTLSLHAHSAKPIQRRGEVKNTLILFPFELFHRGKLLSEVSQLGVVGSLPAVV
jgi:hypothetical protein